MPDSVDDRHALTSQLRLLRTKLFVPQVHPELVVRSRLFRKLDESRSCKLTLISAPAGFGKTTLLSAWVAQQKPAVGWVSLDARDNDPVRFWAYVIAALQSVWPGIGEAPLALLQSPQPPPIEGVLVELLNEVAAQARSGLLILDDYHAITEAAIHEGLSFLLDNLPAQLAVILSARVDPPLTLARLRARRQLLELRAPDLRFTSEEAEALLNRVMGLSLEDAHVTALEALTEGWAAGLQLAALSLQEVEDVGAFVASFSGSHRYVFDYLAHEILNRQTPEAREFLLRTSILSRMSADLCDAVLNWEADSAGSRAQEMLVHLERANLFLVPLDRERRWYRYHHLFADFLRAQLAEEVPLPDVADLHRRASRWYADHDAMPDAIDHALAGGDAAGAMELVTSVALDMFHGSELRTLLAWIERLPRTMVRENAYLTMAAAWAALATGRVHTIESRLQDIERLVGVSAETPDVYSLSPELRGVLGEVACIRASLSFNALDFPHARQLCDQARAYLTADVPGGVFNTRVALQGVAAFNLAIVQEYSGETQAALDTFEEAIAIVRQDENPHLLPMCMSHVARLHALQGHLHAAARSYHAAVEEVGGWEVRSPLSGMAYTGLGGLFYEWDDLDRAADFLKQGVELGRQWFLWEVLLAGYTGLAYVDQARGEADGARVWLQTLADEMDRLSMQWAEPALDGHRALLAVHQGDLALAIAWADTVTLPPEGPVPYILEEHALVLARVRLAQQRLDEVLHLLDRLIEGAEAGARGGRVIEALVLKALALEARHDRPGALVQLGQALEMAELEGYVRTFVDAGPQVHPLLAQLAEQIDYAGRLLARIDRVVLPSRQTKPAPSSALTPTQRVGLLDPLTAREREVLACMAEGLTNQEIAERLFVTINTIKTHVKNIYGKLDVHNRTQATLRATELDLL